MVVLAVVVLSLLEVIPDVAVAADVGFVEVVVLGVLVLGLVVAFLTVI